MTVMTATPIHLPADPFQPFTVGDLEGMPDDGRRYELVDGVLLVSPAPGRRHQKIGYRLYHVIESACPPEFDVIGAPFAVHFPDDDHNELQPLDKNELLAKVRTPWNDTPRAPRA